MRPGDQVKKDANIKALDQQNQNLHYLFFQNLIFIKYKKVRFYFNYIFFSFIT